MPDEWFYIKDKKKQGPLPFAQLQQLAASGQLLANDMVMQSGTTRWAAANTVAGLFAVAPAPAPVPVAPPNPFAAPASAPADSPFAFSGQAADAGEPVAAAPPEPPPDLEAFADATTDRMRPHQGGLILGMGIASLVTGILGLFGLCGGLLPALYAFLVFSLAGTSLGIPVWVKGGADLRKMKHNLVDPAGEGATKTGRLFGLIGAILGIVEMVIGLSMAAIIALFERLNK